jgi:hypothetical protein
MSAVESKFDPKDMVSTIELHPTTTFALMHFSTSRSSVISDPAA